MSEALATEIATFKSDLADAAKAGQSEVAVVFHHGLAHLIEAAKGLHPNIAEIEAALKPAVTEVVTYAFSLMPGSIWVSFIEPKVEDFVNHLIDLGLHKAFPAAT